MAASAQHDTHEADPVARALATAHGILPDQGPIGVFIHHNTLHAFQHLPFHAGVQQGAAALGAQPYCSLRDFRAALAAAQAEFKGPAARTMLDFLAGTKRGVCSDAGWLKRGAEAEAE